MPGKDYSRGSLAPPPGDSDQLAIAPIITDNVAVGSVHMWVYGSEALLSQTDEEFRNNSYQAMVFATALAIVLASCIGFLFARTLVSPINRMTTTAKAIKEGDLSARTELHGEDEIAHLGETFDAMADSIERDRELERRLTTDVAHELRTPLMAIQCRRYPPPARAYSRAPSRPRSRSPRCARARSPRRTARAGSGSSRCRLRTRRSFPASASNECRHAQPARCRAGRPR